MKKKLFGQFIHGYLILGNHQDAGGVLVDAVHQSGPDVSFVESRHIFQVPRQGVDEGAAVVAVAGVYHHTGRFVDHQEIIILKNDIDRDIFGKDIGLLGRRNFDSDRLSPL